MFGAPAQASGCFLRIPGFLVVASTSLASRPERSVVAMIIRNWRACVNRSLSLHIDRQLKTMPLSEAKGQNSDMERLREAQERARRRARGEE